MPIDPFGSYRNRSINICTHVWGLLCSEQGFRLCTHRSVAMGDIGLLLFPAIQFNGFFVCHISIGGVIGVLIEQTC